ncbi:2-amino-4-hydroxy-6-hydroxymethyldihydropteridine diphosphokinase [Dysgonomonas sp. Marseille-P4677]|uniref:2-amino-4-hydroxy-6- hydroxymethyldihydropteridine diphosphokinase n=1 Tax=Dysgonomonas sp. Marseille-P4677 TaxID=2364790 RepID=UPI001914064A|nr:2-amino-4-hydroxy-6-hydroxymethyldihydropteridine diphosphokinase [Dysgonomonas sp. Marseille-P4677]MBK5719911.1 2-amino-4-hydroxy-6-hydroxymethyldihydropteridine diphosphokinase [Dysgonomonas sp. Marseille-P4677]
MNKILLSIGTNENREASLVLCHQLLNNLFEEIHYSETSITKPYGVKYHNDFLNQLAIAYTEQDKEDIHAALKELEKKMGRKASDKESGIVVIDIDIVIWNQEIIKATDIERTYIKDLLPTLDIQLLS